MSRAGLCNCKVLVNGGGWFIKRCKTLQIYEYLTCTGPVGPSRVKPTSPLGALTAEARVYKPSFSSPLDRLYSPVYNALFVAHSSLPSLNL